MLRNPSIGPRILRFSPKSSYGLILEKNVNMNHHEEVPDFLGGLGDMLPADVLKKLNELLEQLHRKDKDHQGSPVFIYAPGSQYVEHVDNQYFYGEKYLKQSKTSSLEVSTTAHFSDDTPLSALFRKIRHEELRKVIESWRPYLIGDDTTVDALAITHFEFDKKRIYSNRVYYDLLDLDALGALQVSLSQLACYLADHSNLSSSQATLYRQLKMYKQERT